VWLPVDYETTETSAAAWIYIAMIRIQLCRLAFLIFHDFSDRLLGFNHNGC
jgi:hypothetical protein